MTKSPPPPLRWLIVPLVVFGLGALAALVGGIYLAKSEIDRIKTKEYASLSAIGSLKATQVEQWRTDFALGALRLSREKILREAVEKSDTAELEATLRNYLGPRAGSVAEILLFNPQGGLLLSVSDGPQDEDVPAETPPALAAAIAEALQAPEPVLSEMYQTPDGIIHLDALAAVRDPAGRPLAVVVLRENVNGYLFPLLQSWPTESKTAQTVLVRRDADEAIYLNNLRQRPETAMTARFPLSETEQPAVQAALGKTGIIEGRDEQGKDVLADARQIPRSSWSILATLERQEMFADIPRRLALIASIVVLLILLSALSVKVFYDWKRAQISRSLEEARERQREAEEIYQKLFDHMLNGFAAHEMIYDDQGRPKDYRFVSVNSAYERITGLRAEALIGRTVLEVLPRTEPYWFEAFGQVLRTGQPATFENYSVDLGQHFEVSAFQIAPNQFGAIIANVTERKVAENKIRESEERFRSYIENAPDAVFVTDPDGFFLDVNPSAERISGYSRQELIGKHISDLTDPQDRARGKRHFETLLATGEAIDDVRHRTKAGKVRTWNIKAVRLDARRYLSFIADVHDLRQSEEHARLNAQRAEAFLQLPTAIESMDEEEFIRFGLELAGNLTRSSLALIHFVGEDDAEPRLLACSSRTIAEHGPDASSYPPELAAVRDAARKSRAPSIAVDQAASTPGQAPYRFFAIPVIEDGRVVMLTSLGKEASEHAEWDVETVQLISNDIWHLVQRRRGLAALRASGERFRNVIETSQLPFALYNLDGQVTYLNSAFTQTFGYGLDDVPTIEAWWPKAYPDPLYRERIQAAWRERVEEVMANQVPFKPLEATVRCKDGSDCTMIATASSLGGANQGEVIVNFFDITPRKAAERRIFRLSQIYLALSESSEAIVKCKEPLDLFRTVCRVVVEHGGLKMACVGEINEADKSISYRATFGDGTGYLAEAGISANPDEPGGQGPTGIAARENRPVWCQDFINDPSVAAWHERGARYGWRSLAAVPLRRACLPVAILTIYSDVESAFDAEVRTLIMEMADNISFALDNFDREDARQRAETDLQISRDMLAKVINSSPQAFFWKDRNSVYLGCNQVFADNVGLETPEQIVGKTDFDLPFSREDSEGYRADDAAVMQNNRPMLHKTELQRRDDGKATWIDTSKVPLLDSEGSVYGVLGIVEDITERKAAEEELSKLRKAVEQSANNVLITDAEGVIQYVNPAFERSSGYTREEALGCNPRLIKSDMHPTEFYRDLWTTIKSGRSWQGQLQNKRKDGTLYWESAVISPVTGDRGEILYFIAVKEDISERKTLESSLKQALSRAETASRAKSEFLAVMSHELRTPLNGVLGFAELLSETSLSEEQQEFVRTIRSSGDHLLHVVNDVLDFSSIEQSTVRLDNTPFVLADLLESASMVVRAGAEDKMLEFRHEMADNVPHIIRGDARRIRQILINLLGNAVKFTEAGSVNLRVTLVTGERGEEVEFAVADTGPGISLEDKTQLFKPFTQGDSTLSRRYRGTGLGLAISLRLAQAMGGDITIASTPGKGSTFAFHLPCDAVQPVTLDEEEDDDEPIGAEPADRADAAARSILVVEDDRISSILAGKMVSLLGYRVEVVRDGRQALEAFRTGKYCAILMDLQMPGLDGVETTLRIRAAEATGMAEPVPIIALTANVMPGNRERCLAAGMNDFLAKPLRKPELAEKLSRLAGPA